MVRRTTRCSRIQATTRAVAVAATCLLASARGAGAAERLRGLELVVAQTPPSTTSPQVLQVDCPPGKVAVSGGGTIVAPFGSGVVLRSSVPVWPTGWTVTAVDTDGGTSFALLASAICAIEPPGLQRIVEATPMATGSISVDASCPGGLSAIGGGATILGDVDAVALHALFPSYRERWEASGQEIFAEANGWFLVLNVVCAAVERSHVVRHQQFGLDETATSETLCPPGFLAIAGGAEPHSYPLTGLTNSGPYQTFTIGWGAAASSPHPPPAWTLESFTACHSLEIFSDGFELGSTVAWSP